MSQGGGGGGSNTKPPGGPLPAAPPIIHAEMAYASDLQWNRPVPAEVHAAVASNEKCNRSLMQLLDSMPVTAAMQFAVAYGWMLHSRLTSRPKSKELIT